MKHESEAEDPTEWLEEQHSRPMPYSRINMLGLTHRPYCTGAAGVKRESEAEDPTEWSEEQHSRPILHRRINMLELTHRPCCTGAAGIKHTSEAEDPTEWSEEHEETEDPPPQDRRRALEISIP